MQSVAKHELAIGLALAALLIAIAVLAVLASRVAPSVTVTNVPGGGSPITRPIPPPTEPSVPGTPITPKECAASGGTYNDCGSACRTSPPGTICEQVCIAYCECTTDAQCPTGYACGDYVDGTGVCNPK